MKCIAVGTPAGIVAPVHLIVTVYQDLNLPVGEQTLVVARYRESQLAAIDADIAVADIVAAGMVVPGNAGMPDYTVVAPVNNLVKRVKSFATRDGLFQTNGYARFTC